MLSSSFANDLLKLVFNGDAIEGLAANAASDALENLYISLHTADPGAAGTQETNELDYEGYARVAIPRSTLGFVVDGITMNPVEAWEFGEMTGGSAQTATHVCIGVAETGGGKVLFRAALTPSINMAEGVTPRIRTSSSLRALVSNE